MTIDRGKQKEANRVIQPRLRSQRKQARESHAAQRVEQLTLVPFGPVSSADRKESKKLIIFTMVDGLKQLVH